MNIPEITLKNKVVLITGGSKGLGVTFALACAKAGADVTVFARTSLENTVKLVKKETGKDILAINGDMQNISDIKSMILRNIQHFGKLDVLVNNAAIVHVAKITETTEIDYDRLMNINLKGVYFACKYAAEHMIPRKSGVIINIGSDLSHVGSANYTAYCTSKGGILLLSKSLAVELGSYNIRVVTLSPGPTNTDMSKTVLGNPEIREMILNRSVLGQVNEPVDLAPTLVLLASDAARMVTGCNWSVDGGVLAK
jgi:glucose 1-dehydrogenase